ncbi:helix-turn-helix domain-containing protein [Thermopetrobacter sp. TC1]|uniref:helix-turn-helix domain-containing protein n=1 Tax=Thermopetrobacter sp. TC1 TaxID=1495045 RepID=UPI00068ACC05|nr:helix-turn-helix domain-containing protein [Thermopetrobacter sp. TC1]
MALQVQQTDVAGVHEAACSHAAGGCEHAHPEGQQASGLDKDGRTDAFQPVCATQAAQDRALLSALKRRRDRVFAVVASAFGLSRRALKQAGRDDARAVFARQVGLYLLHVVFSLPMQTVGQICGKDRTTVAHACRRVEDFRENAAFDAFMHDLELAVSALESAVDMRHRHGL